MEKIKNVLRKILKCMLEHQTEPSSQGDYLSVRDCEEEISYCPYHNKRGECEFCFKKDHCTFKEMDYYYRDRKYWDTDFDPLDRRL